MWYADIDGTGLVLRCTDTPTEGAVELPEDLDPMEVVGRYVYRDGEFTESAQAVADLAKAAAEGALAQGFGSEQFQRILEHIIAAISMALDDDALMLINSLLPVYDPAKTYSIGAVVTVDGRPQRKTLGGWEVIGGETEWVQPLTAEQAYSTGDKVTHSGKTWESTTDYNVWEPGVSGWHEVADGGDGWPEWVQPTGAHDAYAKGAEVAHSGKRWTSDIDANVWEPGVYGWTES